MVYDNSDGSKMAGADKFSPIPGAKAFTDYIMAGIESLDTAHHITSVRTEPLDD